ncbi:hypothetical protein PUN28_016076 [Cardiocondyla obscurior]
MNKIRDKTKKVSLQSSHKLGINTTHHVETTFLPNGKMLKQSQLAFYPVKNNGRAILSSSVSKATNTFHRLEQKVFEDVSSATENDTDEISEDVVEISPTQRNITSRVKRCLKLKRKMPVNITKKNPQNKQISPGLNLVPEIIKNIDFGLCPSPENNSVQMKDNTSSRNTADTSRARVNMSYLSPTKMYNQSNIQFKKCIESQKNFEKFEDETFYLPAEQALNKIDINNSNLGNLENKPPEKKMLLDKFNILPKKKTINVKHLNMRCKADRAKLNGWDCWECKQYYENLSLPEEELQRRKNQCSRHRSKYKRPDTPEGFWDPEFPETMSNTYREN